MKKNYHYIISVMRISLISFTLLATFSFVGFSKEAKGQLLTKKVPGVAFKKAPLTEVIRTLEKEQGLKFAFDEQELHLNTLQSIALRFPQNATLNEVFKQIFLPHQIAYREYQGIIYLSKAPPVQQPGKVYGKIIDDKGENLPGASVKIIELNRTISAAVDGSYSFSVPEGTYTMEVTYISYQTKRITGVVVKSAGLMQLNVTLNASSSALKTVTIESSFKKEAVAGLYAQQKNAASITDGVSAEQIARTPDNNMGQVMKRISGINTVDNRYVVVRGLTERYNQGMIDGIVLPSTDMNRHNFSFDVIPVEMVSNVVVNKTATPDVSAEFAGGQVSVNTLDIPLENFTVVSLGTGFNSNTLGKEFLQSGKRGKYDFLGFDDGHRKMPKGLQSWGTGPIPDYAVPQSKLFSSDAFKTYKSIGGLNQNYRFSIGRAYDLKSNQKWGFIAGLSLRNSQDNNIYGTVRGQIPYQDYPAEMPLRNIDNDKLRRDGHIYKYNTTAGAQFNIGLQGGSYKIGFKNMFSQVFNNTFNISEGAIPEFGGSSEIIRNQSGIQDPEIIRILQNKLEGEHKLTSGGLKLTWLAAHTRVRQETKDRTRFSYGLTIKEGGVEYYQNPNVTIPGTNSPVYDYRIFTDTRETNYNWALNLSQPFNFLGDKSLIKAGYNGIWKRRSLDATTLNIRTEDPLFDKFNRPYEELMDPKNMGTGPGQAYYEAAGDKGGQFDGKTNFHAGYLMLDQRFLEKIRLVYGLRAERYDMKNVQSATLAQGENADVTGENNTTYLPSVNFTYSINSKMNIRASFAKTIIRPDFRELSYFGYYDAPLDGLIVGGNLSSTSIKNTDLRYEWYPSAGEIISVSGFYKTFDKPIELVVDQDQTGKVSQYRYQNQKNAINYGLEAEIRKSLGFIADKQWLRNISLFGNGAIIKSKIHTLSYLGTNRATVVENNEIRALFGQSPYIINAGVGYTSPDYGLTLSYNRSGRRTYTIASNPNRTEYENGRDQVDLQLFCRFLQKKIEIKLNIGNLLNSTSFFYMNGNGYKSAEDGSNESNTYLRTKGTDKYEKVYDDIRYRVRYGINSNCSVSYKF